MENFFALFPRYGKFFGDFSTVWKIFFQVFHSMENRAERALVSKSGNIGAKAKGHSRPTS